MGNGVARGLVGGRSSRRLRRSLLLSAAGIAAVALGTSGCASGDDDVRTVLVDYVHDEVASSFIAYFPRQITVRPGDTIRFQQEWTGEPHSVTMGTHADEVGDVLLPLWEKYAHLPDDEIPDEAKEAVGGLWDLVIGMMPDGDFSGGPVNQNAAQPCFLDTGMPPEDPMTPCTDEQQVQPPFNGRQSYYNSGFINYQGDDGNVFEVELAEDIAPGTYFYYCNFHGIFQHGTFTVVPEDQTIPSQDEVSRQARAEIDEMAAPLIAALEQLESGTVPEPAAWYEWPIEIPIAGFEVDDPSVMAFLSEFVPKEQRVRVGDTVSWTFVGGHTVSFNPPDYFSELTVEDDGTVIFSPDAIEPRGGPGYPEPPEPDPEATTAASVEGEDGPADGEEEGEGEPPPPVVVDVGEWDGDSFLSSGIFWDGTYSVTFTRPGTYAYACLVHPQMVGTVIVEEG